MIKGVSAWQGILAEDYRPDDLCRGGQARAWEEVSPAADELRRRSDRSGGVRCSCPVSV